MGGPRPSTVHTATTMSTLGRESGPPTSLHWEVGGTEEDEARQGQGVSPRGSQEGTTQEATTVMAVSLLTAHQGRRMEAWADMEDQPMTEADAPEPAGESTIP